MCVVCCTGETEQDEFTERINRIESHDADQSQSVKRPLHILKDTV